MPPFENAASPMNLDADVENEESRCHLAKMTTKLMDLWKLDTASQLNLLGFRPQSRALLSKYRNGQTPFPLNRDLLDRVGWLLSIHKSLRLLYPQNEARRYAWVSLKNQVFDHQRPIDLMLEEGLLGIYKVARYLDFQRGR